MRSWATCWADTEKTKLFACCAFGHVYHDTALCSYLSKALKPQLCCCRAAALPELYDYQDKVLACMRSTLWGPVEGLAFAAAWLYVLSSFQLVMNETVPAEPTAKAVKLGDDYLKAVADMVKSLLIRIAEVIMTSLQ